MYIKISILFKSSAGVQWPWSFSTGRERILLSMCRLSVITLACFWLEELSSQFISLYMLVYSTVYICYVFFADTDEHEKMTDFARTNSVLDLCISRVLCTALALKMWEFYTYLHVSYFRTLYNVEGNESVRQCVDFFCFCHGCVCLQQVICVSCFLLTVIYWQNIIVFIVCRHCILILSKNM